MRQVHFPSDEESTERMRFLLDQIPEKPSAEPVSPWALEDQIMAFLEKIALYSPSENAGGVAGDEEGRCVLSSIHQSKGLEWMAVFVVQCLEGVLPSRQSLKRDEEMNQEVDEERRLMFVAMSRAKRFLYLTYPKPGVGMRRSRFCEEVIASQKPKQLAQNRKTEFSSARRIIQSKNSAPETVKEISWKCDDQVETDPAPDDPDALGGENDLKRAKTAPAVLSSPSKPASGSRNAFSVLMASNKR